MRISYKILVLLLSFYLNNDLSGQIKSIGLRKEVSNPISNSFQIGFFPKCKIDNNAIFVATNEGIFRKNLTINSDWELYAFKNIPITEFVKNKEQILAISPGSMNGEQNLLLLSNDNGKSYIDYTSSHFLKNKRNYISRIIQNPLNPNSLLVSYLNNGVSKSSNFGQSWNEINSLGLHWYINYHPLDTTTIFYSGESDDFSGVIYKTLDNGATWDRYTYPYGDNSIHNIAFHPTDQNILVYCGENVIAKSIDKGITWKTYDLSESGMYFYKVLFDQDNVLYASGIKRNSEKNEAILVYRSTDMGESWHLAYDEKLRSDCGGVIDMVIYNDKLIFYTKKAGLFELNIKTTPSLNNELINSDFTIEISRQPNSNFIQFNSNKKINSITIVDITGKVIMQIINSKNNFIDVSHLLKGIHFFIFNTDKYPITKKIAI